ncbi:phosphoenolpyruvate synthase [Tardiphaga sp. vice352]|uniref:phosphoenolpyruvate synthase n=1 Tax=unclassified Tardiphaga TaxID=2631404 RepID=UPI001162610D|nr:MULTISPECIES: phosphoenolpyruvate synthase [unclassified Tardiphaga]QDM14641.1 phosphoenolpyruvate synthase [Tardiphaga sp. vice278]QDM24819.1 phosphoenolpyruvate synthase [Tardiphaga sp. vice304]QDM30029.1 phosphoenolpyruvate synthase [Tardiphaga sp. vice352]
MAGYIRSFLEIGLGDVASVGGKTASLGELYSVLAAEGVAVPDGFAITADAYRTALSQGDVADHLHRLLDGIDKSNIRQLASKAAKARAIVYAAMDTAPLRAQIMEAYRRLEQQAGPGVAVAVRSSATAEDLPTASFAGQHESFLNVRGANDLFEACRRCFASIFTDRAISYRIDNGFDHFKVALSVAVMKMVRSDLAASGVIFTLDTESGFRDVVFVTGCYGLGETIVQGQVDPDEFYVHKPTLALGFRRVLRRKLGAKQVRMIYGKRGGTHATLTRNVPAAERQKFCISDAEVLSLADNAVRIEAHYSKHAGGAMPMDIEWAKDGADGKLYIIQARPETVASQRSADFYESYSLTGRGEAIVTGRAVGEKIATGRVRRIATARDLSAFKPGEILVAPATSPDWEPVMKIAAGIVTDKGGRTCHAAIVARELGIPAVVGATHATDRLKTGASVTVCCAEGDVGSVYPGIVPFDVTRTPLSDLTPPRTAIMVNVGTPEMAFRTAMQPQSGVGLARMEFIISEHIGVHPMALLQPDRIASARERTAIARLVKDYQSPSEFFVQKLSEGVGTIAAAFYPKPVIVRLSDFKTNEYASLLGGQAFESKEENPMLGFRGASRYSHPAYAEGFALECAALRRVRDDMGLSNLRVMVPFCRTVAEGRRVIATMAANGLTRGEGGLEVYVMCEIPNNVIQIDAFAELFDGFSIGSNDLTQLTLGVDRDSDIVAFDFDERDPGMLEMFRQAVAGAKRSGRHVGICGEAPANYPEIARYLTGLGIDSISVNPGSVFRTMEVVRAAEADRAAQKP